MNSFEKVAETKIKGKKKSSSNFRIIKENGDSRRRGCWSCRHHNEEGLSALISVPSKKAVDMS